MSPYFSDAAPGYTTPMPELPFLSSLVWNPSHTLPSEEEPALTGPSCLPVTHERDQPKHVLLDSRLIGAQLKVVVNGGSYKKKEVTASIESVDEQLTIGWKSYKTWKRLELEWVTPKHPNGLWDNGLLVVISGAHCGKYVRQIYHRYKGDKLTVILGVVNRLASHPDTLSEERLYLEVSSLCLCKESEEDKNRNKSLMNSVRAEASNIRAK